ncbi:OLC1v1004085C1 [Oldenlandia corymbosa var. corymbosa]|uniref:OLC1v1004085C1 n=1 Tax=Oldenlandia corymbosa var. corymbosa TaxID=529605 RepID=A0AAV1DEH2_OLDCO|nr:OLC1v1004085C1 [Oldenlandia corymbosa var. corymbosa]
MEAAAHCVGLVPCLTRKATFSLPRGCAKNALNPSSAFIRFDSRTAKRVLPAPVAISALDEGKSSGLASFPWTSALPLNKAVTSCFAQGMDQDIVTADSTLDGGSGGGETTKMQPDLSPKRTIEYEFETTMLIIDMEEAVEKLELARSEAKESGERLEEEKAALEEAEKQSEAAQAALKEHEVARLWVLNLLATKGQDLPNDFCSIASNAACDQLDLARTNANNATLRLESAKASLKIVEENAKAAQDAVDKSEEVASRAIKSAIEIIDAELDSLF